MEAIDLARQILKDSQSPEILAALRLAFTEHVRKVLRKRMENRLSGDANEFCSDVSKEIIGGIFGV